jgi:hypothetical protein
VDSRLAAETKADSKGLWAISVPPLAVGEHKLAAVSIDFLGKRSPPSAVHSITVLSSAPLDFFGKGETSIGSWRKRGDKIIFNSRAQGGGIWRTTTVKGVLPAVGDYDDDGITDLAAVGISKRNLLWTVLSSARKKAITYRLGKPGDTVLGGCRLGSGGALTPAVFDVASGVVSVIDAKTKGIRTFSITPTFKQQVLLGCGDTNGDGAHELLFSARSGARDTAVIRHDLMKGIKTVWLAASQGDGATWIPQTASDAPLVTIQRQLTLNRSLGGIESLGTTFEFPTFYSAVGLDVTRALLLGTDNKQAPGILWANQRTGKLTRRLLGSTQDQAMSFGLAKGFRMLSEFSIAKIPAGKG